MDFSTEFVTQVAELFAAELECQLRQQSDVEIAMIEGTMREMLRDIGAHCLGVYLTQQEDAYSRLEIPCTCGDKAVYRGRRAVKILSVFGWVPYRRAYYLCSGCQRGQSPLDWRLGLEPGKVSAGLAPLLALAGIQTSFGESSQMVEQFMLLEVSENTVRNETQNFGRMQRRLEKEWIAESQDPEVYRERHRTVQKKPKRLYATLDGAKAPLKCEWREMKVGAWFETETVSRDRLPAQRRGHMGETGGQRAKNISYYCDIQEAREFGGLVWATGCRHNADLAEELIFLGDGAAWIWKIAERYYPHAVQIVDWYHAEEYLERLAEVAFEDQQAQAEQWFEQVRTDLWEGRVTDVIIACREYEDHPQAQEAARKAISYYTNNQERMDYARYRRKGYMIGSGTVESGCKQIVTQRLKRSGARWLENGACSTAKARAAWLSGQWSQLKARRSKLPLAI